MNFLISSRVLSLYAFLGQLFVAILYSLPINASANNEFCWKGSQTRGVGTIPVGCNGGRQKEVGMCYTPCKAGWEGAVTMCLRTCPSGYVNTGLTCHVDKPLLVGASVDACNLSTSCPSGYTNAGLLCGLNTPPVPSGYSAMVAGPAGSGLDLSREIYDRGIGLAPSVCEANKENDTGLCYPRCNPGFSGVGPVCWGQCPAGWVQCGMGCAASASACGLATASMVKSVGLAVAQSAALIASLGTSAAATTSTKAPKAAESLSKLQKLKDLYQANKAAIDIARTTVSNAVDINAAINRAENAVTDEEIAAAVLIVAGLFDPTGWAEVAASYTYPTCEKIGRR